MKLKPLEVCVPEVAVLQVRGVIGVIESLRLLEAHALATQRRSIQRSSRLRAQEERRGKSECSK